MSEQPKLERVLSLLDATMINTGGIIGSGIFMVPATVALLTGFNFTNFNGMDSRGHRQPFWCLVCGRAGGGHAPRAGGQFVYLNEAYGPVWGYLYGWSAIAVINTATIAAIGVAFSEYLSFFFPFTDWQIKGIAITSVILLTILNIIDVKAGARAQNVFTLSKIGAIMGIIILGLVMDGGSIENIQPFIFDKPLTSMVGPLGLAMVSVLWTYDGWIFITYVVGEVKNPGRNIPLSLIFCMLIVTSIYLLINLVFTYTLGIDAMGASDFVVSDSASIFLGEKGVVLVTINTIIEAPRDAAIGAGIILAGLPLYYYWKKHD